MPRPNSKNPYNEQPTAAILQMLDDTESIIARRHTSLRSVVIVQEQRLLFARTYGGKSNESVDRAGRGPDVISPVHSVTKSVIALLIGILIDRGSIKSTDQSLTELLHSRSQLLSGTPVGALTLHHLLSMTAGFLWRDARAGLEPMVGRMMKQSDWVAFVLSLPVDARKTGQFQYNTAVSHLLSAIVAEAAGQSTADFANEALFAPLGISEYEWESDPQQINLGGWGLSISALSMAKLGLLCLNGGQHNGEQLLSSRWIERMWTPHSEAHSLHALHQPADFNLTHYGYQWWIRGNDQLRLYCAEGLGGQSIYCLPEHRAVIVTSCDYPGRRGSLWPLFEQHWIPAVTGA